MSLGIKNTDLCLVEEEEHTVGFLNINICNMQGHIRNDIFKFFQTIIDKNLYVKEYDEIMSKYGDVDLIKNFFPRIDKQVTVSMNHLIKMPFSVHPDTLNISVPLDPYNIVEYEDIPTLSAVISNSSLLVPYYTILNNWNK